MHYQMSNFGCSKDDGFELVTASLLVLCHKPAILRL